MLGSELFIKVNRLAYWVYIVSQVAISCRQLARGLGYLKKAVLILLTKKSQQTISRFTISSVLS